jgi:hypothetical protein
VAKAAAYSSGAGSSTRLQGLPAAPVSLANSSFPGLNTEKPPGASSRPNPQAFMTLSLALQSRKKARTCSARGAPDQLANSSAAITRRAKSGPTRAGLTSSASQPQGFLGQGQQHVIARVRQAEVELGPREPRFAARFDLEGQARRIPAQGATEDLAQESVGRHESLPVALEDEALGPRPFLGVQEPRAALQQGRVRRAGLGAMQAHFEGRGNHGAGA